MRNKRNSSIMCIRDKILAGAAEARIDGIFFLIDNQSTYNVFINGKYLSNVIATPGGKYICVHCNAGVAYTKNIVHLPR